MKLAGNNNDRIGINLIDETMFFVDASAPKSLELMFQRFGFTKTFKRFYLRGMNKINDFVVDFLSDFFHSFMFASTV